MLKYLTLAVGLLLTASLSAQPKPLRVAIVVHEGAEILDWTGPAEVFKATASFCDGCLDVYLVAPTEAPIISQGFIEVKPNYSIANAPQPDILVIPGGGTGRLVQDEAFMTWFRNAAQHWTLGMSVCTGVLPYAKEGLLNGKIATTWYGALDGFAKDYTKVDWRKQTRYVDNQGLLVTTAGVSAGIDGALHVIGKLLGMPMAKTVAQYMEYDKWDPSAGLIIESDFVKAVKEKGADTAIAQLDKEQPFYPGELVELSKQLAAEGRGKDAEALLNLVIDRQPQFTYAYEGLADVRRQNGQPAPPTTEAIRQMMKAGQVAELKAAYDMAQQWRKGWRLWRENDLNVAGYQMMEQQRYEEAIGLLQLNVEAYPQSFNAYDSLGEAYMKAGRRDKAIKNYRRSLELNPQNTNAVAMLNELEKS